MRHHGSGMSAAHLALIVIDERGQITHTAARAKSDPAAPPPRRRLLKHMAGAIQSADADLDRRRAEMPEPEPEQEPLPDRATEIFLGEDPYEAD